MNRAESKNPTLSGSDIIFDCGRCGKSLAIDCRGAGLNISCPHCDSELGVPIPEGFDLAELDKEISESISSGKTAAAPAAAAHSSSSALSGEAAAPGTEGENIRIPERFSSVQRDDMLNSVRAVRKLLDDLRVALDELGGKIESLDFPPAPPADASQRRPPPV
jgi:transcription elongation factor Elf1